MQLHSLASALLYASACLLPSVAGDSTKHASQHKIAPKVFIVSMVSTTSSPSSPNKLTKPVRARSRSLVGDP